MHFVHRGVESDTRTADTMALRSSKMTHERGQWLPFQYSLLLSNTQPGSLSGSYKVGR